MLKFFIKRPITTIMFVLFWVVLGISSYPKMNTERIPPIDLPLVTATFVYPGASPIEIETSVVQIAEDKISEVSGLKKITSQIFENGAFVMAEFNLGVNVNDKAAEVKTKIDSLGSDFPDELKQPVIEKFNPLQQSVVDIVLTGENMRDLHEYADDILAKEITAIRGVAGLNIFGGDRRAVRIEIDPERLTARGLSTPEIVAAIGRQNINVPSGKLENQTSGNVVRMVGEFSNIGDIKNMQITNAEGQIIKLIDVARITDGAMDIQNAARFNGKNVVIASVVKANDGNAIKISSQLQKNMPEMQKNMSAYFANKNVGDVSMEIISDSSVAIKNTTNNTIFSVLIGIILTIVVLLVFTRNWRSTIISAVVIPTSILAGFFFMQMSGFSINTLTLLAIATALGTLVANAIVLIEAALQRLDKGMSPEDAALDGTKSVATAVLAGTGTNVVVFLPLAFMGGIAGQFMAQFGMTVVYLTLISLLISFTLTPMLIAKFLKRTIAGTKLRTQKNQLGWYRKIFDSQVARPWRWITLAVIVFILSAMLMRFVGNEFAASSDTSEINITARAPVGATYEKSAQIAEQIEQKLKTFSSIQKVSSKIGENGMENINVKVGLIPRGMRESDKAIAQTLLESLSGIPDAQIQIKAGESVSGAAMSADLVLNIGGADDNKRNAYADALIQEINQLPEVATATNADQKPGLEIAFIPDENKMKFWGISNAAAGGALRTALYGNDTYKYKENGNEYPIIIEYMDEYKTPDMFNSVYVNSPKGLIGLNQLGSVAERTASPNIRRLEKQRITQIDINIGKSTIGPVQNKIQKIIDNMNMDTGYTATFGGLSETQAETTGEISHAFLLAVVLTFMLLAAILNSWVHPFTIATSILTSFSGVFIFMFLFGATINIAAMLSFVMLVGLVVNNNILLLEPTIVAVNNGKKIHDALWENFGDKTRMLLMTTITIAASSLPQLFSAEGMQVSMGAVIIGGVLASLFWTYFLTPVLFVVMEKLRTRYKK